MTRRMPRTCAPLSLTIGVTLSACREQTARNHPAGGPTSIDSHASEDMTQQWLHDRKLTALPHAGADTTTHLPRRVRHEPTGMILILMPPGEFMMGSPANEVDRQPSELHHRRLIGQWFYLGETEVTVGQYRRFVAASGYRTDAERGVAENPRDAHEARGAFATVADGEREWNADADWRNPFANLPDEHVRDDLPVMQVSWMDARAFVEHHRLSLPTSAQWEYAARAGGATRFAWGDDPTRAGDFANLRDAAFNRRFNPNGRSDAIEASIDDGFALPAPVASFRPNAWGLHDMIGNVEEWVEDRWNTSAADGDDERAAASNGAGSANIGYVLRGGAYNSHLSHARSASRTTMGPHSRRDFIGFRVALIVER